ncbi:MAG: methyltransferase domain-containing protein [Candidatus Falkowbacteria bacterium]|nr:MAG: methyltransferase domain-containing protein [Candidatus Falkowbacteria bacterium]
MDKETIIKYYNYTLPFYKFFYHKNSNAVHYGFFDKNTKNHQAALLNVNQCLADISRIKSGDVILDAGCGIGGSSIWLAKNYPVKVIGISISGKQINEANRLSVKEKISDRAFFYERDFLNSGFSDESFDIVWAIESVCHADDKKDFLKEAYRLLKPGGRLVIDDGFLLRKVGDKKEQKDYDAFLKGMALPNLASEQQFKKDLENLRFQNIKIYDKTKETWPSAKKIYRMSIFSYPFSVLTERLQLTPHLLTLNNLAGITQYRIIKNGLAGHRVFYAEK